MGPGGSGPLPPTVNPGLPQASSGPAGIPVPSKPGVPGVLGVPGVPGVPVVPGVP